MLRKFGDGDSMDVGYITFFPSSAPSGPDSDSNSVKQNLKIEKKIVSEVQPQTTGKKTNIVVQIPKQMLAEAISNYRTKQGQPTAAGQVVAK